MAEEERRLAAKQRRLEGELAGLEEAWEWGRRNGGFDSCTREEQEAKERQVEWEANEQLTEQLVDTLSDAQREVRQLQVAPGPSLGCV